LNQRASAVALDTAYGAARETFTKNFAFGTFGFTNYVDAHARTLGGPLESRPIAGAMASG
jgi:hypothetical protein